MADDAAGNDPEGRPRRRGGAAAPTSPRGGPAGTRPRCARALDELRRVARTTGTRTSCRPPSPSPMPAGTTGEWAGALREVFGEYRAPTGVGGGVGRAGRRARRGVRARSRPWPSAPAGRLACSWPSPDSTGTPTAPSRSRWRPATPGSRSSTRASGSAPSRSWRRPATRTSTSWGSRSCRGATSSSSPRCSTGCAPPGSTPGRGGRHHPARGRRGPAGQGRGRGLHAQGLRARPRSWTSWSTLVERHRARPGLTADRCPVRPEQSGVPRRSGARVQRRERGRVPAARRAGSTTDR